MLSRHFAIAMGSRVLTGATTIGVSMILASAFAPESFAGFRFYQITLVMLAAVAGPGISLSASKLFALFTSNAADDAPPVALFCAVGTGIAAVVAMLLHLVPQAVFAQALPVSISLLAMGVFLTAARAVPIGAMIGLQRFGSILLIDAMTTVLLLVGVVLAIQMQDIKVAVWALIVAQAIGLMAAYFSIFSIISWSDLVENFRVRRRSVDVKRVLAIAGPNAVIAVFISLQFWGIGRVILASYEEAIVFAAFSIGVQWFSLAAMVPEVLGRTVFPKIIVQIKDGSAAAQDAKRRLSKKVMILVFASTVGVTLGAFFTAPYLI